MSKWIAPSLTVFLLVCLLSVRLLSDPDLGFHLNAGRWIVENKTFPVHDFSTYTVTGNEYIDLHWLFQVGIYFVYRMTGYSGLSLLVTILSLTLLCLTILRSRMFRVSFPVTLTLVMLAYLIMEPRIILRPEMITFLCMSLMLILLDLYYHTRRNLLFLVPAIMLLWCNSHGLFILGFLILGAYFVSILLHQKKTDRTFILWMIISFLVAFCNPYFFRGVLFPFELMTRFEPGNIFNQHIREFIPFYQLKNYTIREFLFILFTVLTFSVALLTFRKRKIHEFLLLAAFLFLAMTAVRNIPLFILVAFPVTARGCTEIMDQFMPRLNRRSTKGLAITRILVITLITIISTGLAARIYTNAWYQETLSNSRTGIGLDREQQPVSASEFLLKNKMEGRIINSLGFGGWLSWTLPQPVFIDARLEVIREDLYREVYGSWHGRLNELIEKYGPDLVVYNYQSYYPWTVQLSTLAGWHLVYLDGLAAVYLRGGVPGPSDTVSGSPFRIYSLPETLEEDEIRTILNLRPRSPVKRWLEGFYRKQDETFIRLANVGSFCLQVKDYNTAQQFFLEALKRSGGTYTQAFFPLADIFRDKGDPENLRLCYQQILYEDPANPDARAGLENIASIRDQFSDIRQPAQPGSDATIFFNDGNRKYREGDYSGAVADFSKAIRLNPRYAKAYNNRGIVFAFALKQYEDAKRDFDSAISLNRDYGDAYLGRGSVLFHLRNFEGACRDWRRSADLGIARAAELLELHCKDR